MTHPNPLLSAAWAARNGTAFEADASHRTIDDGGPVAIKTNSPRTRARALGFAQGWEAAQHAILNAVTEFNTRYIVTNEFGQVATLAELAGAVEKIIRQHAAVIRPEGERKEAA